MPLLLAQVSFLNFIWKDLINRIYLVTAIIVSILIWAVFKSYYIHPNIIFDSYYYIQGAVNNWDVGPWPIGYSKFLQLVGLFSHSALVLVTLQYFLLQLSLLLFFFTLRYFLGLGRWMSAVLFIFLFINPLFIYTCNHILSDALFTAISVLWLVQLFWIICRPRPYMIFTQAILLFLAYAIRYYALYYPVLACLAFLLSQWRWSYKLAGMGVQFFLIGGLILFTIHKNEQTVHVRQFSPFGSWKLASNALYMYSHIPPAQRKPVPAKFAELDNMVRSYFDAPHDTVEFLKEDPTWGSYYMFIYPPSPLIGYMLAKQGELASPLDYNKFAQEGLLYDAYAKFLFRSYPHAYLNHVVWPNTLLFIMPHKEVYVDSVNPFVLRKDPLGDNAVKWFGVKDIYIAQPLIRLRSEVASFYPMFNTVVHFGFVLSLIIFLALRKYRGIPAPYVYIILTVAAFWLCNFVFSIFSLASLLRYELLTVMIEFAFTLYFLELIYADD